MIVKIYRIVIRKCILVHGDFVSWGEYGGHIFLNIDEIGK